jgi:transposase
MRRAPSVKLHSEDRRRLLSIAQDREVPARIALRARVVLRAAEGGTNRRIAQELRTNPATAARWRQRFLVHGVAGIVKDAPRPGRPPRIPDSRIQAAVRATLTRKPPDRAVWSARSLARDTGLSKSTVQRIWRARGINPGRRPPPERSEAGFEFVGRITDLVGVYLSLFERVVAFSTDERLPGRRLSALGGLPLSPPRPPTRRAELLAFLKVTDRETPQGLDVHLMVDRRFAPPSPPIERWLSLHPRFHLHILPADAVGRDFFDDLVGGFSKRRTRPGAPSSPYRLQNALREHFRSARRSPTPFVWTATADEIRGLPPRASIRR